MNDLFLFICLFKQQKKSEIEKYIFYLFIYLFIIFRYLIYAPKKFHDLYQWCKRVYGPKLGDGFGKFYNPCYITLIPKHCFEINNNNNNNDPNPPLSSSSSSSQPITLSSTQRKQTFSSDDLLVISDTLNYRIVLIEKTSGKVKSIIGKQGSQPGEFKCPMGTDRKSTRLNSSHSGESRMPSSA